MRTYLKKILPLLVLLFAIAAFSSCNRGYGCPTFSVENNTAVLD